MKRHDGSAVCLLCPCLKINRNCIPIPCRSGQVPFVGVKNPREEAAWERVWAVDVPVHHLDHIVRQGVDGRLRQADLQDGFVMFIFVTLAGGESGRRNEMGFDRKESERLQ